MPQYDYRCSKCEHVFDRYLKMDNRKQPESEPCPKCGEMSVEQTIAFTNTPISTSLEASRAVKKLNNASQFKEKLQQIHDNTPGSNLKTSSTIVDIK